jgi:hypothetical protein
MTAAREVQGRCTTSLDAVISCKVSCIFIVVSPYSRLAGINVYECSGTQFPSRVVTAAKHRRRNGARTSWIKADFVSNSSQPH